MPRDWMVAVAVTSAVVCGSDRGALLAQTRPLFRAGVDLVSLSVTAIDPTHRYVTDLERDNFEVLENGVRQHVTFFGRTDVPLALALLLDTSASMQDTLAFAQDAAIGFIRQLEPMDLATVLDFDTRVRIVQRLTNDRDGLEQAIRGTRAGGSTALYHAVYIALKELNKMRIQEAQWTPRRRSVILLSDGEDTASLLSVDDVLDLASRSDAVVYAIGLGVRDPTGRRQNHDAEFVLRQLAQQTGGRAFFPLEAKNLAGVYGDIRRELASQYWLAYESSNAKTDGQFRRVAVRVTRPGVVVRTRQGYYARSK